MAGNDEHKFDRRVSDVNAKSLAIVVQGLEGRVEVLELQGRDQSRELIANTKITQQAHEISLEVRAAVLGHDQDPGGLKERVDAIYEIVGPLRDVARGVAKWGGRLGRFAEWTSSFVRRYWWALLLAFAGCTYLRTGRVPDWVLKALSV